MVSAGAAKLKPGEQMITVTALPLYHIFALTCCALLSMRIGGKNLLIPNPRDIPAFVKELRQAQASTCFRRSTRCSTGC